MPYCLIKFCLELTLKNEDLLGNLNLEGKEYQLNLRNVLNCQIPSISKLINFLISSDIHSKIMKIVKHLNSRKVNLPQYKKRFGTLKLGNRVTKSSYAILNETNIKVNFELLTRRFNFYFSTFELLTRG